MKKNTLQKVLATAMVGAMAMGTLTGCGSGENKGSGLQQQQGLLVCNH